MRNTTADPFDSTGQIPLSSAMALGSETAESATAGHVRAPWVKSVRAAGSWQGSMTTELRVREFGFRSDEPVAVGGTNSAPTPMELMAGAVNGCITVTVESVAKELGIHLDHIETETSAHMDVRGFQGTADVSPHFIDYTLTLRISSPSSDTLRSDLRTRVEKRCPAVNLIRDAGVPFELLWEFTDEQPS